jgi:hypothetical protein
MKKLLLLCVLAATSSTAQAEILDKPKEIIAKVQSGAQGAWMDTASVKRCLKSDVGLEKCRGVRDNLQKQVDSLTRTNEALASNNSLLLQERDEWADQSKDALREAQDARIELNKWYRNPWVTGVIGLAAGAVTVAIVVSATR